MCEKCKTHRLLGRHVAVERRGRPWRSAISGRGHPIAGGATGSWWRTPGWAAAHSTATAHSTAAAHAHPWPCCWPSWPCVEAHATARRTPARNTPLQAATRVQAVLMTDSGRQYWQQMK